MPVRILTMYRNILGIYFEQLVLMDETARYVILVFFNRKCPVLSEFIAQQTLERLEIFRPANYIHVAVRNVYVNRYGSDDDRSIVGQMFHYPVRDK